MPPRHPRGPKLSFISAKTGAGDSDVFSYIAVSSRAENGRKRAAKWGEEQQYGQ
ncbi:hypothetical protein BGW80DRAFT_1373858, partial [Lactifluus volemus]